MHWYAVRVTYSRELFFKDYLDAAGIENYIPMRYEYVVRKERRLRKLVPAVHNLVFVRSTRERMFVRVRHDRRVVVNIEGVMAVATTFVHASLVEEIGEGS